MLEVGEILALNLKRLRKARGWTAEVLAERADLDFGSLRRIETNGQWVSRDSVAALASALNVPPTELFKSLDDAGSVDVLSAWTAITKQLGIELPKGALKKATLPEGEQKFSPAVIEAIECIKSIGEESALRILRHRAKNEPIPEVEDFVGELEKEIKPLRSENARLLADNAALRKQLNGFINSSKKSQ